MSSKSSPEKNKQPSTLQKSLAFGAVLLLCALIYLLVSLQENTRNYALSLTDGPAATPTATPAPTLPPGVSMDAYLSRLNDFGLSLREGDDGVYLVKTQADGPEDTLVLYTKHGYVRGFSLTMQETSGEKVSSSKGDISKYIVDKQREILKAQAARITECLPVLLSALTEENDFPHSTALIWADEAAAVLESGKSVNESKHGLSFAALRTQEEKLLISADLL